MNDQIDLKQVMSRFEPEILGDPVLLNSILMDLYPENAKDRRVFVKLSECGVYSTFKDQDEISNKEYTKEVNRLVEEELLDKSIVETYLQQFLQAMQLNITEVRTTTDDAVKIDTETEAVPEEFDIEFEELKEPEDPFERAIRNKNLVMMNNLGIIYEKNNEIDLAEKWFKKAAKMGYARAMNNLGYLYFNKQQYKEAEKWYLNSVKFGDKEALFNLAVLFKTLNQENKAITYFIESANNDNIKAIKYLGSYYRNRNNFSESEKWLLQGSYMDDFESMYDLAQLYKLQNRIEDYNYWMDRVNQLNSRN